MERAEVWLLEARDDGRNGKADSFKSFVRNGEGKGFRGYIGNVLVASAKNDASETLESIPQGFTVARFNLTNFCPIIAETDVNEIEIGKRGNEVGRVDGTHVNLHAE